MLECIHMALTTWGDCMFDSEMNMTLLGMGTLINYR